jgi:hypothetical protein
MVSFTSTEFFSEPGVTFAIALIAFAITISWRSALAAMITGSTGVALAILFRVDSLVLVLPLTPLLLRPEQWKAAVKRPLSLLGLGPIFAAMLWTVWYNNLRYHSYLSFGYRGQGFRTPLWDGLHQLLFSAGRGFFWFNLILLPGLWGAVWLWQRSWRLGLAIAYGVLSRVVFYSKWQATGGGPGWGPRFLLPCCLLLALGLGEFMNRVLRREHPGRVGITVALVALGVASGFMSFISWWVPYDRLWAAVSAARPGDSPTANADRIHAYFFGVGDGLIAGTVRLLRSHASIAPEHLRDGPSRAGLVVLGLLAVLTVLIVGLTRRQAAFEGPPPAEGVHTRPLGFRRRFRSVDQGHGAEEPSTSLRSRTRLPDE